MEDTNISDLPTKENVCEHNFFKVSETKEIKQWIDFDTYEFFTYVTLACSKCGETKQIKVNIRRGKC
jgi:hypothetical protein